MSSQNLRRSPRKLGQKLKSRKKTEKKAPKAEPPLPKINWSANKGAVTWALIGQMEVKENRLVLFGKQSKDENTSGESKIAVYKRIGGVILPDLFATSPNALAKRVKCKAEGLVDAYKKLAKKLQVTGGGLRNEHGDGDENNDSDGESNNDDESNPGHGSDAEDDGVHQYLDCYITAEGPDHDTTEKARNLWESIVNEFEYFPALHKFLAARSNIVPPVITTGVGPEGRKVVHLQPPTQSNSVGDAFIDPSLRNYSTPHRRQPQSPASSPIEVSSSPTPPDTKPMRGKTAPQPSTFQTAVNKVKANATNYKPRKTFEDSLVTLQTQMLESANARENAKLDHDRARLRLEEINQLLQLHTIGILSKDVLAERIKIVEARYADPPKRSRSPSEAGPSKRHRREASSSSNFGSSSRIGSPGSSPEPGSEGHLGSR